MTNVVITSAARTGVGSFDESFSNIPAHDLEPEEEAVATHLYARLNFKLNRAAPIKAAPEADTSV
ncbi:MAG: hypothetical protein HOI22_01400 [Tateyamaria sp.]|jgi:acetyl-CoA acetyltransferase|nr:hypothetical protein [Tateyamaria sp.]